MIDYYNLPLNDPKVYELWETGHVKGIFQSDSNLGIHYGKLLKPENIEHIAALGSIVRPGVLEAKTTTAEGKVKSVTESYCDRKNNREEITCDVPLCEDILQPTYGHMIYQEQLLAIASRLANLTLEEADKFRKAVGKKKVEVMKQAETMFIEGCKKAEKITDEQALAVFDMMRKSVRYLFNKSHALAYGIIGYYTAYAKTYHPLEFFCANLEYAQEKMDPKKEIKELISDMKFFNIVLRVPSIIDLMTTKELTFTIKNGQILFGLSSIKGIGESKVREIVEKLTQAEIKLNKKVDQFTWTEILFNTNINKTAITNLISVGAFDSYKISRKRMLFEYNIYKELSSTIQENIKPYPSLLIGLESIVNLVKKEGGPATKHTKAKIEDLIKSLKNPSYSLEDDIRWIFQQETELLGCNITCSKLDYRNKQQADTRCIDFINKKSGNMKLCVEIDKIKEYTIKKGESAGKKMAFLTIKDDSGSIDCGIFAEKYEEYKNLLYEGNTITICGFRSKKDTLNINSVYDL